MIGQFIAKQVAGAVVKKVMQKRAMKKLKDYVEKPNDLDKKVNTLQKKLNKLEKNLKGVKDRFGKDARF